MKNALKLGRKASDDEERALFGTSQDSDVTTDNESDLEQPLVENMEVEGRSTR